METSITVEQLGKQYRIGSEQTRHENFRELLMQSWKAPFRRFGHLSDTASDIERFWALRDISFSATSGDVIGLIGANGAGKSTLLKLLSRVTAPTSGEIRYRGRLASLLEVGTGFHPELTGRENIYLNGAILGMRKREIARHFDEIVAFAGIEKFLDTPVKRYSSGMYVRLGFSVAAHLETDILLVDEVLAVGDAGFQNRCLGKLGQVSSQGRTVIFVSHNMNAIVRLCNRCLWVDGGRLQQDGVTGDVVQSYLASSILTDKGDASGTSPLGNLRLNSRSDSDVPVMAFDESASISFDYRIDPDSESALALRITDGSGAHLFTSWDNDKNPDGRPLKGTAECSLPARLLRPGRYFGTALLLERRDHVWRESAQRGLEFQVSDEGCPFPQQRIGYVAPLLDWGYADGNG